MYKTLDDLVKIYGIEHKEAMQDAMNQGYEQAKAVVNERIVYALQGTLMQDSFTFSDVFRIIMSFKIN